MKRKRGRTRGRTACARVPRQLWNEATVRWARCEWFVPWVDAPFLAYSEFKDVLNCMGLAPRDGIATRAEWGRLRAAMCNYFEASAAPRRLSAAFLHMERRDLALYRADVRAALRGRTLPEACDPASGVTLKPEWYARYRFPPPDAPAPGSHVVVWTGNEARSAQHVSLVGDSQVRVRYEDGTEEDVPDLSVMKVDPTSAEPTDRPMATDTQLAPIGLSTPPGARRFSFGGGLATPLSLSFGGSTNPGRHIFEPLVSVSPKPPTPLPGDSEGANVVEAEVDVQRLATLIRIMEKRQESVGQLRRANDAAENELQHGPVSQETRDAAKNAVAALQDLSSRTDQLLPDSQAGMPFVFGGLSDFSANKLFGHTPSRSEQRGEMAQSLFTSNDGASVAQKLFPPTPKSEPLLAHKLFPPTPTNDSHIAHKLFPPTPNTEYKTEPVFGEQHPVGSTQNGPPPPPPLQPIQETEMKTDIDFNSSDGALSLGRALARKCIGRTTNEHPKYAGLHAVDTATKNEMIECVAACVALTTRARMTRDPHKIEELFAVIKHRFPNVPSELTEAVAAFRGVPKQSL